MGSTGSTNNIGYNNARMRNIENIREQSEQRGIAEEARRQRELGNRTPNYTQGQRLTSVSHEQAQLELYNAPVGTVIEMESHQSGDYVGEYTRTSNGWTGSQRYKSDRVTPPNVTTANGFAMQVTGNDVRVLKVGSSQRRRR